MVPTIYKAYIRPKFQGISPQNMAKNMVLTHFRILKILTDQIANFSLGGSELFFFAHHAPLPEQCSTSDHTLAALALGLQSLLPKNPSHLLI